MDEVQKQLEHHVKEKDRRRARRSGEPPWFETFRRLAKEQGCSLSKKSHTDFDSTAASLTRAQVSALARGHDKDMPNLAGSDWPPIIFSDNAALRLIDGSNRVNRFLADSDDARRMEAIIVAEK